MAKHSSKWQYATAKAYVDKMTEKYGKPDYEIPGYLAIWKQRIGKIKETYIKDERIAHPFPMPHFDFLYSVMDIKVPKEKQKILADATESIFVDRLKGEVTARCAMLIKNGISLGFVEDVVAGKVKAEDARKEYARRIINSVMPSWFKDPMGEFKPKDNPGNKAAVLHSTLPRYNSR